MIPREAIRVWADALSNPCMARVGATRHAIPEWSCVADLDKFETADWSDAGFTESKLIYLQRRYPVDRLPDDGCILSLWPRPSGSAAAEVLYRRVDVTRGWLADVLYLRHLGWRGLCLFRCVTPNAMLHAVNASAVAPAVHASGLWKGAAPVLARTLRRAVVHRRERRHEAREATRRVNDWAHRIASVEQMTATIDALDAGAA